LRLWRSGPWVDAVDAVYHFALTGDGGLAIRSGAVWLERLLDTNAILTQN